jgi:hypothetical protein
MNINYRIGIIDDFNNSFSYVEYKKYGEMEIYNACKTSCPHKGYQDREDAIHIFINFKKIGVFKIRTEANSTINRLIKESPVNLEQFIKYLIE